VTFDYTSNPDKFVFCHASPEGFETPTKSMPVGTTRYNVGIKVNTASAPTWSEI
jgi:hypothetical protein